LHFSAKKGLPPKIHWQRTTKWRSFATMPNIASGFEPEIIKIDVIPHLAAGQYELSQ
jgi:hypothetical protein